MSVPSPFLINLFGSFCSLIVKSSATDLKCFWPFNSKKLPPSEAKTKVSHWCGLNYSFLSFKIYS